MNRLWAASLAACATLAASAAGNVLAQDSFGGGATAPARPATTPRPPTPPPPAPGGAAVGGGSGIDLDRLMAREREDYGIAASAELHQGAMHGPTPSKIPGGQLITTKGLLGLVQGRQAPFLLFDVLGAPEMLPGAIPAVAAAQPGSFDDEVQRGFGAYLERATRGDKRIALVFYCQSTHCWMSYNAALRAIRMGYTNVLWYRGGLEAWKEAGLAVASAQRPGPRTP